MSIRTLMLLPLLLLAAPALAQQLPAVVPPATLQVTASAEIKTAPDLASLSAGVVTSEATAAAALSKNAAHMTAVMSALKAVGIADADIQTSGISVNPQYDYNNGQSPRVTSYQASNSVTVTVRQLDGLGRVIDVLVAQGANQINGPSFGVDKPEPLLDQARAQAVAKARARAEIYARAAGLKLGRILSISEGGAVMPPPMPMMRTAMAMDAAASTPVAIGQSELSATVSLIFELVE